MTALIIQEGDRIRATSHRSTIVGTVEHVYDSFGGWIEVRPDGLVHTHVPCYFEDPWAFELLTEVP